jgi:hypothetical protein
MKKKKLTASEKGLRINEQRFGLIITLCNIIDTEKGVSDNIKSAICASLINMMQTSFIPGDDDGLANLINHSVDGFCLEMITQKGIEDYRSVLETQVKQAKTIVDTINKKIERIKEGEDILKNICLN